MQSCAKVPPLPPYSSGTAQSSSPMSPISRHDAESTRCAACQSGSRGASTSPTKRRTVWRNDSSSSSIHGER
jgi:hypothetical protein